MARGFNKEERQFLKDLLKCNNDKDYKKLQDKHEQEKFNHLKHRAKDKA